MGRTAPFFPVCLLFFRRRIYRQSLSDDPVVSGFRLPDSLRRKTAVVRGGFLNLVMYLSQKPGHIFCPNLTILFTDRLAETMPAGVSEISFPMIMNRDTVKFRQNTAVCQSLLSALRMDIVQLCSDYNRFRNPMSGKVFGNFGSSFRRNMMTGVEIHRMRLYVGTILNRLADFCRKFRFVAMSAFRTSQGFSLMSGDFRTERRYIGHLTSVMPDNRRIFQRRLTVFARPHL